MRLHIRAEVKTIVHRMAEILLASIYEVVGPVNRKTQGGVL
jgi:hypothetical protein